MAFTSAKGLDVEWCKSCDRGLPAPDCVIYLDIPVEDAAQVSPMVFGLHYQHCSFVFYAVQRGQFGEERYERIDFQKAVRGKFMQLQAKDAEDGAIPWFVLDARKSIEDLHAEITAIANDVVLKSEGSPIKKLWL